jgi:hypothetical protein
MKYALLMCDDESDSPSNEELVSDGPFAETKDFVGGFVVVDCDNLDDAIAIAAGHPFGRRGGVEIRPVWE